MTYVIVVLSRFFDNSNIIAYLIVCLFSPDCGIDSIQEDQEWRKAQQNGERRQSLILLDEQGKKNIFDDF